MEKNILECYPQQEIEKPLKDFNPKDNMSFAFLEARDVLTQYVILEYCLKDNILTDEHYKEFLAKVQTDEMYKHLSALVPKSYDQLLSEFQTNAKVIVNNMLEYQLGENHSYVEPIFRLKKEENTQSQEHSEEKWEVISDIKQHILKNSEYKIFLLVADSGIGKTTFLLWLNKYILNECIDKAPIYITGNDLKGGEWNEDVICELKLMERNLSRGLAYLDYRDNEISTFFDNANKDLVFLIDGMNYPGAEPTRYQERF